MVKAVKGFIAQDGTFFEREPECKRYECIKVLTESCESHGIEFDNFIAVLKAWHIPIREYYNADDECEQKQAGVDNIIFYDTADEKPLPPSEEDRADPSVRDKDAKGFLEQQIRGNK